MVEGLIANFQLFELRVASCELLGVELLGVANGVVSSCELFELRTEVIANGGVASCERLELQME